MSSAQENVKFALKYMGGIYTHGQSRWTDKLGISCQNEF